MGKRYELIEQLKLLLHYFCSWFGSNSAVMFRVLFFTFLLYSFGSHSQGTAGIYKIRWQVDKRLTNNFTINNNFGNQNNLIIPAQLYDSVLNRIVQVVTNDLRTDTRILYLTNDRGNQLLTPTSIDQVGGLPRGTKRKAMQNEYLEYYVKFRIRVGVTKSTTIGTEVVNYSRLRPFVRVKMKAKTLNRWQSKRKSVRKGGFPSIGSVEFQVGGTTMTNNNALSIEQVVDMVFKGLEKFDEKIK